MRAVALLLALASVPLACPAEHVERPERRFCWHPAQLRACQELKQRAL